MGGVFTSIDRFVTGASRLPDPWDKWVLPVLPEVLDAMIPTVLAPHLIARKVLTLQQYRDLNVIPTERRAAEYLLLEVLARRLPKQATFNQFCEALAKIPEQKGILELIKCEEHLPSSQNSASVCSQSMAEDDAENKQVIVFLEQEEGNTKENWKQMLSSLFVELLGIPRNRVKICGTEAITMDLEDCFYFVAADKMKMCIMIEGVRLVDAASLQAS
eukprot:m.32843 g.32843  ORF g.32843 m.32843 type:complete len:217 (+) comp31704_c0_seq1:39-689(+)